jgi:HK97 family phage major capsid protein
VFFPARSPTEVRPTSRLCCAYSGQRAVNTLSVKLGRPGASAIGGDFSAGADEAAARGLCELKHFLRVPRADAAYPFAPTHDDVGEASLAIKAMRRLLKTTSLDTLDAMERKALTSFQLGSSGFILPPEWASQILSCLENKTDLTGWVNNIPISGPSLKMFMDNTEFDQAEWACSSDCFSGTRIQKIVEGLGEIELKPEELRYIVCCTKDVIEDASVDIEKWLFSKVSRAVNHTVSSAIISGDGIGKPQGILHPASHIPICDVSVNTPPGQFTWQDLILLKWEVALQFHQGAAYVMNQHSFALCLTISDATGRPIMLPSPVEPGQYLINGSPVWIATQFPDVGAGTTPVAFGGWKQVYTLVIRRGLTWLMDPFSASFCILQKFSARIGGGITCANAARLLRIR